MKTIILLLSSLLTLTTSQKPGYLGSNSGYPGLANRFKNNASSSSTNTADLGNRFGGNDGTTTKIPLDARGDVDLVNRLNSWARPHRPFWILNAEAIEAHRQNSANFGTNQPSQGSQTPLSGTVNLGNRGSFQGSQAPSSDTVNLGNRGSFQGGLPQQGGFQQYPQQGGFQEQGGFQQYPQQQPEFQQGGFQQYPQQQPGFQQYPSQQPGFQQYPSQQPEFQQYPQQPNYQQYPQQVPLVNRAGAPNQGSLPDPTLSSFSDIVDPNPARTIRPPQKLGSFAG